MKRLIALSVLTLLVSVSSLTAQVMARHNFEIGAGFNFANILSSGGQSERSFRGGLYFEYRYNYNKNLDFGGQINYKYSQESTSYSTIPPIDIVYNQIGLKGVVDYNMLPGKMIRPFIGASVGGGCSISSFSKGTGNTVWFGTIGPRIGLNIWKLRFCLDCDFAYNADNGFMTPESSLSLNISFAI